MICGWGRIGEDNDNTIMKNHTNVNTHTQEHFQINARSNDNQRRTQRHTEI